MELNLAHPQVMRQDIPQTDASKALALKARAEERERAIEDCGFASIDEDGTPRLPKPAAVLPFLHRDADAVFASPNAVSLVVTMQLRETLQAGAIAEEISQTVHRVTVKELTAQQRADVLFASVHALRMQRQCWKDAARQAGIAACETWLKTEGGKAFREMSEEHRHAIAVNLAPAIMCASFGISEGSRHLLPAEYLRITDGAK
jgi:hypothetical protein